MEDKLERIECKIDKVVDHLGSIDVTLAAQHASLKEHIRRTELLEQEVAPIKTHVNMISGGLKLIGLLAALGAGVEGVVSLLTLILRK